MSDNSGFDLSSDFDMGSDLDIGSDFDAGADLDVSSDFDASADLDTDISSGYDDYSSDLGSDSFDTSEYSNSGFDEDVSSDFDESYSDVQADTTDFSYDSSAYDAVSEDSYDSSTTEYVDSYDTGIEGDYDGAESDDMDTDYSAGDYSTEELADEYNNDFENGLEDESAIEEPDSNFESSEMQEETDLTGDEGFESDTEDFSDSTEEPTFDETSDAYDTEIQDEETPDNIEADDTSYEEVDEAGDNVTEDIDGTEDAETETQDEVYDDSFETADTESDNEDTGFESDVEADTAEDETDSNEDSEDIAEDETDELADSEETENSENDNSEDEVLTEEGSEDSVEDDTAEDETDSTEDSEDVAEEETDESADSEEAENSGNDNSEDVVEREDSKDSDEGNSIESSENEAEEPAKTAADENGNEPDGFDSTETEESDNNSEDNLAAKDSENEVESFDNNEVSSDDAVNDTNDDIDHNVENNEMNEALEKFDQENWDSMTIEEQKEAIRDLGDAVAKDLELTNKPNIEFYNNDDDTDFGGYSAKNNTIYINEHNMSDARETADTIAHESRHCWQHERAENPKTEQDREFKENFDDYIRPEDDYQAYRDQLVESDAREYATNICDNINSKANENGLNETSEKLDGNTENINDAEVASDSSSDTYSEAVETNDTEDIFAAGNYVNENQASETTTNNAFDTADETNGELGTDDIAENSGEQNTDHTVETGSEADSEGAREVESVNELNDSLKDFTQENWDSMSPEEQKESINNLRDAVANELGLVNSPNVDFYNNPQGNDYGGYSPDNNTIYINEYNMNDAHETADTIAHESRHCWQHERAENPQNEQDLAFRENFDDYIKPEDDYQAYRDQIVEVDAREYASNVCSRIDNQPLEDSAYKTEVSSVPEEANGNTVSNDIFIEENKPDDLVSKSELNPMSEAAAKKCEEAGLSAERVQELRETPRGDKPEPSEYLSKDYIDNHLTNFEESGCYKIISNRNGEPSGDIANSSNSIFVINGKDADRLISEAGGDPRKLEKSLAMEKGYLGDNPYIIRCDDPQNLRMSTGNETNAWQNEWCPGGTTRGGVDEAIVDNIKKGDYSFRHVFSDEDWKK